jgi:hypothetical protein
MGLTPDSDVTGVDRISLPKLLCLFWWIARRILGVRIGLS